MKRNKISKGRQYHSVVVIAYCFMYLVISRKVYLKDFYGDNERLLDFHF